MSKAILLIAVLSLAGCAGPLIVVEAATVEVPAEALALMAP